MIEFLTLEEFLIQLDTIESRALTAGAKIGFPKNFEAARTLKAKQPRKLQCNISIPSSGSQNLSAKP
jgi:hypothetical protein